MRAFANYYVAFLWTWVQNIWYFISEFFMLFYKLFIGDMIGYHRAGVESDGYLVTLGNATENFGVAGWICLIIVSAANIALIFFLLYRFWLLLRRFIFFRAKEVDKDILLEQIAKLKEQADQLVQEKSKIFALKLGNYGQGEALGVEQTEGEEGTKEIAEAAGSDMRFTKLINLDEKYERNPNTVMMTDEDMLSLSQIVKRFVNFAASQLHLYYTEETIRLFFAGLATSKVIILEGISGTGKTSLPYAMGKFFNNATPIISVQPSWRDRADLVGYFNEFTKKFNETDFLASLYEVSLREDPNFIVLDEMNLARIEYYFADFLSIMEMPDVAEWLIDLISAPRDDDPKNVVYGKFLVPQNVWFVGTANNDDSTFTITDKVYDRAVTLTLNTKADYFDAPLTESYNCSYSYIDSLFEKAHNNIKISDENMALIKELDEFIRVKFKITFGNRIMKQLSLFVPAYVACGGTELGGIDFIITSKILRKFNALNLPFLHKELEELIRFFNSHFGVGAMPYCVDYINDLLKMS